MTFVIPILRHLSYKLHEWDVTQGERTLLRGTKSSARAISCTSGPFAAVFAPFFARSCSDGAGKTLAGGVEGRQFGHSQPNLSPISEKRGRLARNLQQIRK